MKPVPKDVDAYIAACAPEARPILDELRRITKATVPQAEEGISYGIPYYRFHGELAGFDAFTNHVSFGPGAEVLANERDALAAKGYKVLKGTVHIRFEQKVPVAAIKRMLKAKAKLNQAKRAAK
jgi:uncharacterized protein YdhG (YjbR/CyaY superfamily)